MPALAHAPCRLRRVRRENSRTAYARLRSRTKYVYDEAGHLLGEYDGTGALVEETVWLGDIPVATLRPNGASVSIYYVHADQLGAPRTVSRPSDNQLAWRWDTDPFGTPLPNENPAGLGTFKYNFRFPGQYYDLETGASYNYARDYDPQTGRYVESDPLGIEGDINSYAYVADRPTSDVDPLGLMGFGGGGSAGARSTSIPKSASTSKEWNGSWGQPLQQDWVCSGAASILSYSICNIRCCKAHDHCYANNGCRANSWIVSAAHGLVGWPVPNRACQRCNANAVDCVKANFFHTGYFSCKDCVPSK